MDAQQIGAALRAALAEYDADKALEVFLMSQYKCFAFVDVLCNVPFAYFAGCWMSGATLQLDRERKGRKEKEDHWSKTTRIEFFIKKAEILLPLGDLSGGVFVCLLVFEFVVCPNSCV